MYKKKIQSKNLNQDLPVSFRDSEEFDEGSSIEFFF